MSVFVFFKIDLSKSLSLKFHPDKNTEAEFVDTIHDVYVEIVTAYEYLKESSHRHF